MKTDNMKRLKRGQLQEIAPSKAKHTEVYKGVPKNTTAPVKEKPVDAQVAEAKQKEAAAKEELRAVQETAAKMEARVAELEEAAVAGAPSGDDLERVRKERDEAAAYAKANEETSGKAAEKLAVAEASRKAAEEKLDLLSKQAKKDLKDAEKALASKEGEVADLKKQLSEAPSPEKLAEISDLHVTKVNRIKKNKDGTVACLVLTVDEDEGAIQGELSVFIPMEEAKKLRRIGGQKSNGKSKKSKK